MSSVGADFYFSDRHASLELLASSTEERFYCHKAGLKDKALHKLPFLADGPGSGKSRFLNELPKSFASYIKDLKQSTYKRSGCKFPPYAVVPYIENNPDSFDAFKSTFLNALFINISFGNGSAYFQEEEKMTIQESLCLRIFHPYYAARFPSFTSFMSVFVNKSVNLPNLTLEETLSIISKENSCIVLGIDEVNVLHHFSKNRFKELFLLVGNLSSTFSTFFVPILAGTVIGPIKSVVSDSMYPPLHIPLPLLSFDSCVHILVTKDKKYENQFKTNRSLIQAVSDIGGHCRALEILFRSLSINLSESHPDYWTNVINDMRQTFVGMYPHIREPLYGKVIAYSFLSLSVDEMQMISKSESKLTFLNMEESGMIKLKRLPDSTARVQIPFIFVICFLHSSSQNEYSKFWSLSLISRKMYWQNWEEFNSSYMAFRLSLFSKLEITTIPLAEFLSGAQMNIPYDVVIRIPSLDDIKTTRLDQRHPSTIHTEFPVGTCVLNAYGAAYDAFVYLETSTEKLLVAQQMKFASLDSRNPQTITNDSINEEYHKVNNSIAQNIPNTDFILLVLCCLPR